MGGRKGGELNLLKGPSESTRYCCEDVVKNAALSGAVLMAAPVAEPATQCDIESQSVDEPEESLSQQSRSGPS